MAALSVAGGSTSSSSNRAALITEFDVAAGTSCTLENSCVLGLGFTKRNQHDGGVVTCFGKVLQAGTGYQFLSPPAPLGFGCVLELETTVDIVVRIRLLDRANSSVAGPSELRERVYGLRVFRGGRQEQVYPAEGAQDSDGGDEDAGAAPPSKRRKKEKHSPCGDGVAPSPSIVIPQGWQTAFGSELLDKTALLVLGAKGVGKSTLCRYLVNALTSSDEAGGDVYYLDCDIGQPEFTPSGYVSLTKISADAKGSLLYSNNAFGGLWALGGNAETDSIKIPFNTSVRVLEKVWVGCISPTTKPESYMAAIAGLLERHVPHDNTWSDARGTGDDAGKGRPHRLVANMCGWITGLGLHISDTVTELVARRHSRTAVVRIGMRNAPMSGGGQGNNPFQAKFLRQDSKGNPFASGLAGRSANTQGGGGGGGSNAVAAFTVVDLDPAVGKGSEVRSRCPTRSANELRWLRMCLHFRSDFPLTVRDEQGARRAFKNVISEMDHVFSYAGDLGALAAAGSAADAVGGIQQDNRVFPYRCFEVPTRAVAANFMFLQGASTCSEQLVHITAPGGLYNGLAYICGTTDLDNPNGGGRLQIYAGADFVAGKFGGAKGLKMQRSNDSQLHRWAPLPAQGLSKTISDKESGTAARSTRGAVARQGQMVGGK